MAPRRKFSRTANTRRYRKLFLIASEGAKTEPTYFRLLDSQYATIHISCIKGGHASAPPHVLARMEKRLKKERLRKGDEAWLVVDKDEWSDEQLAELFAWSENKEEFGFALSNPKLNIGCYSTLKMEPALHQGGNVRRSLPSTYRTTTKDLIPGS